MADQVTPASVPQLRMVLVRPQLGENIGKAARAMLNFGQTEMVIVAPRDGWPNPPAGPASSGADSVLTGARVVDTVEQAVEGCSLVFATTVRQRGMTKDVVTGVEAAREAVDQVRAGKGVAVLFGPERSGLDNDDVARADKILTVPVNPEFSSLNLAQAVLLIAYEVFNISGASQEMETRVKEAAARVPASKEQVYGLVDHLLGELDARGFFRSEDRRDVQRRMVYNLVQNASMSLQEVQTWRGIIKSLTLDMAVVEARKAGREDAKKDS